MFKIMRTLLRSCPINQLFFPGHDCKSVYKPFRLGFGYKRCCLNSIYKHFQLCYIKRSVRYIIVVTFFLYDSISNPYLLSNAISPGNILRDTSIQRADSRSIISFVDSGCSSSVSRCKISYSTRSLIFCSFALGIIYLPSIIPFDGIKRFLRYAMFYTTGILLGRSRINP